MNNEGVLVDLVYTLGMYIFSEVRESSTPDRSTRIVLELDHLC
jgi:hypothetical protein